MSAPVALVLVSHVRELAEGAVRLSGQMAPGVLILAAGGLEDGSIGTSYDAVEAAIVRATADGGAAVVLTDLGSAVLTTESVLELADEDVAARVRIADAPFVEGAVAAAVAAHGGAGVEGVLAAAEAAGGMFAESGVEPASHHRAGAAMTDEAANAAGEPGDGVVRATRTVRNPQGLHARPAATIARSMAGYDAHVRVNGSNAASVLELMKLAAPQGAELQIEAEGPQAREAVDALTAAIDEGFGEL